MDAYFCWLIGLIGDEYIQMNYQKLLWKLYVTDFVWELIYDKNRAADGLYLRQNYTMETGFIVPKNENCSVLEMLIALARRAEEDIMYDPRFGDRTGKWFWIMLQNLGLDIYDDYHYFDAEIDRILDVFLHHKYRNNGTNGGAFPMKNVAVDLRGTDLWWQMNTYLQENYPI